MRKIEVSSKVILGIKLLTQAKGPKLLKKNYVQVKMHKTESFSQF